MIKVSSHVSGTACGGGLEDAGLEKAYAKQAGVGSETHYLAFIALGNITAGREPPSRSRERQRDVPEPREPPDYPAYSIPDPKVPRDTLDYSVREPRDRGDK